MNQHWFESLEEARQILEKWRVEYNTERPHSSLANRTPTEHVRYLAEIMAEKAGENTSQGPVGWQPEKSLEAVRLTL